MSQPPSAPAPRRSRLGPLQRRLLLLVVGLGVLMLADTLYLLASRAAGALGIDYFAVTDLSLPRFYQSMVLWHTVGGIVLVILALFAAGCWLQTTLQQRWALSLPGGGQPHDGRERVHLDCSRFAPKRPLGTPF